MKKILLIAVTAISLHAPFVHAAEISIDQLYEKFEKAKSSTRMKEYNQRVLVVGEVLGILQGFTGDVVVSVGAPGDDDELARAVFSASVPKSRVLRVKEGDTFQAECKIGYSAPPSWLSLEECVFK